MGKQLLEEHRGRKAMEKSENVEATGLSTGFHNDPNRRERRRQMILQQRGMHP